MNRVSVTGRGIISTLALLSLALLSLPVAAIADQNSSIGLKLRPGERVRITKRGATNSNPLIGIYRSATAESVEVSQHDTKAGLDTRLSVPIDELTRIEVSRRRKHHVLPGILVGFLAGVAIAVSGSSNDSEIPNLGLLIFPPVGALAGALVGSGIVSERWEIVWERPAGP